MSIINEIQEVGLGQLLRRRLGILATGSPAPALAPELMPVMALESDRPEFSYPKGERRFSGWAQQPALAGNLSFCTISNPASSGNLIVLTNIVTVCAVATRWFRGVPAAGTLGRTSPTDFRWPVSSINFNAVCQITHSTVGGFPAGLIFRQAEGTGRIEWRCPVVLAPNTSLGIYTDSVNNLLTVVVDGYERPLIPGEQL